MDKVFSSLHDGKPIRNQWNVEKHVSVKYLLPKVECTPTCMACIAIDNASSTYCAALRTFPTVCCILSHTALDCGFDAVVHTSLM